MRRKLVLAALVLVTFLLQTTVFPNLTIASVAPNLLLILTVAFGFLRGKKEGLFLGFFCGLIIDLFYGDYLGFHALLYMYLGFLMDLSIRSIMMRTLRCRYCWWQSATWVTTWLSTSYSF